MIHYAKIENSPRLQRVLELLKTGLEYSTREIIHMADVCAVNTIITELRRNGIKINVRQENKIFYYRLNRQGQQDLFG